MRRNKREGGQSLVEFALVLPIFMLFLGGIIQFGMIFWGQNTMNQIVRDAGRYAATVPDCSGAQAGNISTQTDLLAVGTILAGTTNGNTTTTWSSPSCPTKNSQVVWVTVSSSGRVPRFFPWLPGDGNVSSTAQYRVEPVTP